MSRTEPADERIDSFLSSRVAAGIEYIAAGDVRLVLERFFAACRGIGRDPGELSPGDLRRVLSETLPRRYPPGDPLGQRTIDVLRTYLAFQEAELPVEHARDLARALEEGAEPFRTTVRRRTGGRDGLERASERR